MYSGKICESDGGKVCTKSNCSIQLNHLYRCKAEAVQHTTYARVRMADARTKARGSDNIVTTYQLNIKNNNKLLTHGYQLMKGYGTILCNLHSSCK